MLLFSSLVLSLRRVNACVHAIHTPRSPLGWRYVTSKVVPALSSPFRYVPYIPGSWSSYSIIYIYTIWIFTGTCTLLLYTTDKYSTLDGNVRTAFSRYLCINGPYISAPRVVVGGRWHPTFWGEFQWRVLSEARGHKIRQRKKRLAFGKSFFSKCFQVTLLYTLPFVGFEIRMNTREGGGCHLDYSIRVLGVCTRVCLLLGFVWVWWRSFFGDAVRTHPPTHPPDSFSEKLSGNVPPLGHCWWWWCWWWCWDVVDVVEIFCTW